jgi:hypothetical protein
MLGQFRSHLDDRTRLFSLHIPRSQQHLQDFVAAESPKSPNKQLVNPLTLPDNFAPLTAPSCQFRLTTTIGTHDR